MSNRTRGVSTLRRLIDHQMETAKAEHQRLLTLVDEQAARIDELQKLRETIDGLGKK